MKAPVHTKTRKPENAKTGGINLWTRKRRKRENGENAKTAKTRKPRKRGKRENGENPKTRKRRKRRKPENGQKCSCFLVFNFSFSGFLGFLGFLVFSFSGFLVPLAAPFWPGRVFYVLRKTLPLSVPLMALEVREEDHKQSKVTLDGNDWNLIWNEKVFLKICWVLFSGLKKKQTKSQFEQSDHVSLKNFHY